MTDRLDRPVWHSLTGPLAHLARGDDQARRFLPDVNMFASGPDDSIASQAAIAALFEPAEQFYMLQGPAIPAMAGTRVVKAAMGVQMVFDAQALAAVEAEDIVPLTSADAADMLALATLTQPGPFLARTHEMSQFFGIRYEGRVVAMAGERMRFEGYSELSGVCTHPDFQGQGLARRLSVHVCRQILARGERPFLHAWASNAGAIRLYESLGFVWRRDVHAAILERLED